MRALIWILVTANLGACVKTNAFQCEGDNSRCTGDGARCEADGFCSAPSAACASGFQYSDTAGDLAGTCVGGQQTPDGPPSDTPPDSPASGCNADFVTLTNGNPGHKYKLITVADDWLAQQDTVCVAVNRGYLAIPDDAAELVALAGLAGAVDLWVGVNDRATEADYREVLTNTVYTSLPIDDGNGNQNAQDCVGSKDGTTLETDACNETRVVVCECNE